MLTDEWAWLTVVLMLRLQGSAGEPPLGVGVQARTGVRHGPPEREARIRHVVPTYFT